MPYAFFRAVEETVTDSLREWRVTDCAVTMTRSGYWAKQSSAHGIFDKSMSSTARDFRLLTPIVLRAALERAGTVALEPLASFRLECPPDTLAAVLPTLAGSAASHRAATSTRSRASSRRERPRAPAAAPRADPRRGRARDLLLALRGGAILSACRSPTTRTAC